MYEVNLNNRLCARNANVQHLNYERFVLLYAGTSITSVFGHVNISIPRAHTFDVMT